MRASHILERYESPDQDAVRILHGIVGEVNAHDPENDIATYLAYPSDKAVQIAGDGLTSADIAEKREMGGWDPRKDPLMRINAQGGGPMGLHGRTSALAVHAAAEPTHIAGLPVAVNLQCHACRHASEEV